MWPDLTYALVVIVASVAFGAILEYCGHAIHYSRRKPRTKGRQLPTIIGVAAVLGVWLCLNPPTARADIGGQVPGPGLCEYPGVGSSAMIMNAYTYWCDFPTEINGSHWHCAYGGGAITATGGVSILMFTANISGYVGGVGGNCYWACPDLSLADAPNPPGAWKDKIRPAACRTVGERPLMPGEQPPPPPPEPAPVVGPAAPISGAVTNPDNPNPDATQNSPK